MPTDTAGPPNALQLVRPRAKAQPPDKQAKPHPRKRGADLPGSPPTRLPDDLKQAR